jgi:ABC-type Fe3+ transport system substrate-binding protein
LNVSIAPLQPVTFLPFPSVLCANAPHPNFGKLFLEWFASSSGQHAIANTGRCPMHFPTAVDTILKGILPPEITSMTGTATNNLDYYVNPSKWIDTYTSIFG